MGAGTPGAWPTRPSSSVELEALANGILPPFPPVLSIYVSGLWEDYQKDRIARETNRLYPFRHLVAKLAVGFNHPSVGIEGNTIITEPGHANVSQVDGLLALPTNMGPQHRNEVALLTKFGANLGYQLSENWMFYGGYFLILVDRVVWTANVMDLRLDPNQIPLDTAPALLPGQPSNGVILGYGFRGSTWNWNSAIGRLLGLALAGRRPGETRNSKSLFCVEFVSHRMMVKENIQYCHR